MPQTTIETTEPSGRIALWLLATPGQHLTRPAVAVQLQIAIGAVDKQLQAGVDAGLLTIFNDSESGRCWRAGPRLPYWQPDAVRPTPSLAKAPAPAGTKQRRPRQPLPALDINTLAAVTGPAPAGRMAALKGHTKHDTLFDTLTADNMGKTGIPKAYMCALMKAAQIYLARRPALKATSVLMVRSTGNEQCGVWRMAKGPAAIAAAPAPQRKRTA
jgi:hypothetical protein